MNIAQIENKLQELSASYSKGTFIYDLLLAYGLPKASIARLQKGSLNLSKTPGEIIWKKKLYFLTVQDEDLHGIIDELRNDPRILKHSPRFIIVTDYTTLLAVDTKTADTLDIPVANIAGHYDFFLPWARMEKA
ncbi:MAG: type IIL restriction-modification enzyme MmeI [Victivallaceae bacterium]